MTNLLPLSVVAIVAMWLFFFAAMVFYEEGNDKRTLLLLSCVIIDLLAIFTLLVPTYGVIVTPAYNTIITTGNTVTQANYPQINQTILNPPYSNSVITLYTIFGVFQGFIFFIFMIWSLRYRLQYKTFKQYQDEMEKVRRKRGLG